MDNVSAGQTGSLSALRSRAVWLAFGLVLLSPLTVAETLYVTDILRLGMYPSPDTNDNPVRVLTSGDALEILERTGSYVRVRTEIGDEGWVKTSYLVEEIPSKTQLAELTVATEQLRSQVAQLEAGLSERDAELASVRLERDQLAQSTASVRAEADDLRGKNAELTQQIDNAGISVQLHWLALALVAMLVSGFIGGWWWTDARQRARHGGYRI